MMLAKVLALILLPVWPAAGAGQDVFDLTVTRVRMLRNQPGTLHIDAEGIAFRSRDGKTEVKIAMKDLREADVADARALRFETYDVEKWKPMERREYTFRAQGDTRVEELAQFLATHVYRPV